MNHPVSPLALQTPINLAREGDFVLGAMLVQPSRCEVSLGASIQAIEPRIMQVLVALVHRKNQVVSRDELVSRCWSGRAVSDDAINRCIARIRRLTETDVDAAFTVETVPRVGYRLSEHAPPSNVPGELMRPLTNSREHRPLALAGIAAAVLIVAAFVLARPHSGTEVSSPMPVLVGDGATLPAGAVFRDCKQDCPEMVVVPSGYFVMGLSATESAARLRASPSFQDDEGPQHEVLISRRFALSRYDITRAEYARFVSATKRADPGSCYTLVRTGTFIENVAASWRRPGFGQTDRDPAVCISWNDANAYSVWLTHRTGKHYRLPSEAEWEFAARANYNVSSTRPVGGSGCASFNAADADYHAAYPLDRIFNRECHDGYAATSPVGTYPPNAFGLFDMLGNVAQWTADCYHPTFDGAPTDGSAWVDDDCQLHVARGGSWAQDSRTIRIEYRAGGDGSKNFSANGFRLARSL